LPVSALKKPKKPRYLELADLLRSNIVEGRLTELESFPTESELCEEHGVSRFTVREALRQLQTEGLIRRRRGSGTGHPAGRRTRGRASPAAF
jgi:DNA-binding GntR family transcriptional regulator